MEPKVRNKNIAVIGAGISGLVLANKLAELNNVVVFDKSRGVGGRMATRRVGDYHFDHGAQFFSAETDEFKKLCQNAEDHNVIETWQCKFAEIIGDKISKKWHNWDKSKYYIAKPQMNSFCKYLSNNLTISLNTQIESLNFAEDKWSVKTTEEKIFTDFDYVLLALPSNQALNLVPDDFQYSNIIKNVKMKGCFTLMLGLSDNAKLTPGFDAAFIKNSILSWVSINNLKPDRPEKTSIVSHSSNEWAEGNIEGNLDLIKQRMLNVLSNLIKFNPSDLEYENIHRWRYANANFRDESQKSLLDKNLKLGVCGDWLISGRVESAFLSGMDLYNNINKSLKDE